MNEEVVSAHLLGADSGQNDVVAAHIQHRVAVVERDLHIVDGEVGVVEFEVIDAGLEVGDERIGCPGAEDKSIGAAQSGHCLISGAGNENIVTWATGERIGTVRADDELRRIWIFRRNPSGSAAVAIVEYERIVLHV